MSEPIAQNSRVRLVVERTVQIQQYSPFKFLIEISSDCGDGQQSKEHLDNAINDLSDYMMVKFEEEFNRHLEAQRKICS